MKQARKLLMAVLGSVLVFGGVAQATMVANYTFENNSVANQATGSLTGVGNFSNFTSKNIADAGIKNVVGQGNVFGGNGFPASNVLTDYFSFSFDVNTTGHNKIYLDGFSTDVDSDFRVQWALILNSSGNAITLLARTDAPTSWTNYSLGTLKGDSPLGIFLANDTYTMKMYGTNANGNRYLYLDNVQMDMSVVPEPGTLVLLGLGLAGLAASRLRKKN